MAPKSDNGWDEWRRHVLLELERLNECHKGLGFKVDNVRTDIAMLKVKSGIWGAIAGMIPTGVLVVVYLLTK